MIEIPVDDVDVDNIGGFDKVAPGSYHLLVVAIDEEGGQKGEMVLDAEVLRGTTPGQEAKVHREYFSKELSKSLPLRKIFALAIALGLTTKEELEKHKAARTSPQLDFSSTVGKQFCMNLERNEYNGKITSRLAWDEIYAVTDKRANHVPLHEGFLKKAGIVLAANRHVDGILAQPAQGSGQQKTGKATPAPTSKPADQAGNMDELLSGAI